MAGAKTRKNTFFAWIRASNEVSSPNQTPELTPQPSRLRFDMVLIESVGHSFC